LCIEILSPEDRISVIFGKCEDYHEWGIETVRIIGAEDPRAWEFRKGSRPVEVPLIGSLTAPGISIALSNLLSGLELSRYDKRMAAAALVSVEEYLSTTYKPACDYVDGVLFQKPMPTLNHSRIQGRFSQLILSFPDFEANPELTVQIRPGKYLVPDVAIQRRGYIQGPYPIEPVHVCIEILSPEDRIGAIFTKCEDYHAWGVETTWVVDPETRRAWEYRKGQLPTEVPQTGSLTAPGISISLPDLFSVL